MLCYVMLSQWSVSSTLPITSGPTWMDTLNLICMLNVFFVTVVACVVYYLSTRRFKIPVWLNCCCCGFKSKSVGQIHPDAMMMKSAADDDHHILQPVANQKLLEHDENSQFAIHNKDRNNDDIEGHDGVHTHGTTAEAASSASHHHHRGGRLGKYEYEQIVDDDEILNNDKWKIIAKRIKLLSEILVILIFPISILAITSSFKLI